MAQGLARIVIILTNDQLETLRAAIRVKLDLSADVPALVRGLPERHGVEFSMAEAADYILRRFASDDTETQILARRLWQLGNE